LYFEPDHRSAVFSGLSFLQAVGQHPLIDICDAVFKLFDSSRRSIAMTMFILLHDVGKSVIIHAVLISLLFKVSDVRNKQPQAEY